jgi:hypothetical protein
MVAEDLMISHLRHSLYKRIADENWDYLFTLGTCVDELGCIIIYVKVRLASPLRRKHVKEVGSFALSV